MKLTLKEKLIYKGSICPYCHSETRKTTELEVYNKEYKGREMIVCTKYPKCDSYVGTHDTGEPLGRLADKELRNYKKRTHKYFDKPWKEDLIKRHQLYSVLSKHLKLEREFTHIGMFSKETCINVINWSKGFYEGLKRD